MLLRTVGPFKYNAAHGDGPTFGHSEWRYRQLWLCDSVIKEMFPNRDRSKSLKFEVHNRKANGRVRIRMNTPYSMYDFVFNNTYSRDLWHPVSTFLRKHFGKIFYVGIKQ